MNSFKCAKCQETFTKDEIIVNSGKDVWHRMCFSCCQCFRPFEDEDNFYEFEDRKYCEYDFNNLFAPKCQRCREPIKGKVIKALGTNWHPDCFNCNICNINLTDQGFIKNGNLALCHKCNSLIKTGISNKSICSECSHLIDQSELIKFQDQNFHAYHFNCKNCGIELNKDSRERKGELFCLRCYDKMGVYVCSACHSAIEIEKERFVTALGKHFHVDHFMCAKCQKPFLGNRYYEKKGLAYCETHYYQLFGSYCFVCSKIITSDTVTALNKTWCKEHFSCCFCDNKLNQKDKFYDVDLRPCCKKCFEKFPNELRKRLKDSYKKKLNPSNKNLVINHEK